jgi:hypothetical protein
MIIPRKVTSQGRLRAGAKKVLVIAVAGYLTFGGGPIPPNLSLADGRPNSDQHKYTLEDRLRKDDEEILVFIKVFLQCQG